MSFRTTVALLFALMAGVVIYAVGMTVLNKRTVVNVADWNARSRTLHLAAPMPSCACMTLRPKDRGAFRTRAAHLWNRLTSFRFDRDPLLDPKDIALVSRLNQGNMSGQMLLRNTTIHGDWSFAFDWAGSSVGSNYEVQAFGVKEETDRTGVKHLVPDPSVGPLDMNALFSMTAEITHGCEQQELDECPWGGLSMDAATGSAVGQNAVELSFAGVRMARQNRALQAQATGMYRGSPGDCGCMLLEVIKAPFTLQAALSGAPLGQLALGQAGSLLAIPYDYADPMGDDFYELTVNGGDERVTDYFRLLGHLDGMQCGSTAATFTLTSPPAQDGTPPDPALAAAMVRTLTCNYNLENPGQKITGGMNLLQATDLYHPEQETLIAQPAPATPGTPPAMPPAVRPAAPPVLPPAPPIGKQ